MSILSFPTRSLPAPSAAVVSAVLQYADLREETDSGCLRLGLSGKRLLQADVAAALGPQLHRAEGVRVIWNEAEAEIVEVLDAPWREAEADDWEALLFQGAGEAAETEDDLWELALCA